MKKLLAFAPLALLSSPTQAEPLQWNNVPVPSFEYTPPAVPNYNDNYGYSYSSPSYVRGPEGTSTVHKLNNNTYLVRDANGNTRFCTVLSNNQVSCR
jgi:hypothetical protein